MIQHRNYSRLMMMTKPNYSLKSYLSPMMKLKTSMMKALIILTTVMLMPIVDQDVDDDDDADDLH